MPFIFPIIPRNPSDTQPGEMVSPVGVYFTGSGYIQIPGARVALDESTLGPRYSQIPEYMWEKSTPCDECGRSDEIEEFDRVSGLYDQVCMRENWRLTGEPRPTATGHSMTLHTRSPIHAKGVWFRVTGNQLQITALTEEAAIKITPEDRKKIVGQSTELWETKNHPTSSMAAMFRPDIQELYVENDGTISVRKMTPVRTL